jgi:hypothetical protein
VSVRFLALARRVDKARAGLSLASTCVLWALADHADTEGRSFPSQALLALETGMGERHVRRCLGELAKLGPLEWSRGGRTTPNHYRLRADVLAAMPVVSTGSPEPLASEAATGLPEPLATGLPEPVKPAEERTATGSPEPVRPDIYDTSTGSPEPRKRQEASRKRQIPSLRSGEAPQAPDAAPGRVTPEEGTKTPAREPLRLTVEASPPSHRSTPRKTGKPTARKKAATHCPGPEETAEAIDAWCRGQGIPPASQVPLVDRMIGWHQKAGKPRASWLRTWQDWQREEPRFAELRSSDRAPNAMAPVEGPAVKAARQKREDGLEEGRRNWSPIPKEALAAVGAVEADRDQAKRARAASARTPSAPISFGSAKVQREALPLEEQQAERQRQAAMGAELAADFDGATTKAEAR